MPRDKTTLIAAALRRYVTDPSLAFTYDEHYRDTELLQFDTAFLLEEFAGRGRVLDIGCGTGRHLIALSRAGHPCVGMDLSWPMLNLAQAKLSAAAEASPSCVEEGHREEDAGVPRRAMPRHAEGHDRLTAGQRPARDSVHEPGRSPVPSPFGRGQGEGSAAGGLAASVEGHGCPTAANERRATAQKNGDEVPLVQATMRAPLPFLDSTFDHVICMFSTMGVIPSSAERLAFVREVRRVLKPGGTFVLHVHNRLYNLVAGWGLLWLLKTYTWNRLCASLEVGDKILDDYRGVKDMYLHVFSLREVRSLLAAAGLIVLRSLCLNDDRTGEVTGPFASVRANGFIFVARRAPGAPAQ